MRVPFSIIAFCFALILGSQVSAEETIFHFDYDLEGMSTSSSSWHFADRGDIGNKIPSGGGGFAVLSAAGTGDQLFSENISLQYGLDYSITYFVSSETDAGTTMILQKRSTAGSAAVTISDLSSTSTPSNTGWMVASGHVEPTDDATFAIFCETPGVNPAGTGGYLWGCAIDVMTLTTGDAPTTTTVEPSTVVPGGVVVFDFENGTDGWVLGRSNGAAWRRTQNFFDAAPPSGEYILRVSPTDFYSSVAKAMSPRLRVGETGTIVLAVDFFMEGSTEWPAYLKLRRTTSFSSFDDIPALNLDAFGDQANTEWQQHGIVFRDLTPGEEFNIVMEASLGSNNYANNIAVSRVQISGCNLVEYPEEHFFDFDDGLVGWSAGSVDGGRWLVYNHSEIDANFYIPPPTVGDSILVIDRFDIHSGVITIESPPISFQPATRKEINLNYWMRGSAAYPSSLRIRRKTLDGSYDALPFVDLTPFGNANNLHWKELEGSILIPDDGSTEEFQLVIEADLGGGETNLVAIDAIKVITKIPAG